MEAVATICEANQRHLGAMLDRGVSDSYRSGLTQSAIIHVTALLVLSLVVAPRESPAPPVALAVTSASIRDADTPVDLGAVTALSLPPEESEEKTHDALDSAVFEGVEAVDAVGVGSDVEDMVPHDVRRVAGHVEVAEVDLLAEIRNGR